MQKYVNKKVETLYNYIFTGSPYETIGIATLNLGVNKQTWK